MRRRRLPATLAVCGLAAAAALSGCSSGSGGSGASAPAHPTFVYLQTDGSQSYFVLEGDGAKARDPAAEPPSSTPPDGEKL